MKIHDPATLIATAQEALDLLKEGNARFVEERLMPRQSNKADREVLAGGQKPFAAILCCSDSRVSPEIFFDQKLGDLFVIRNAGNIVDETVLGSIEYAVEHLDTHLVVVCGHSKCGAVTAACEGGELPPNIESITRRIAPACALGQGDVDKTIRENVRLVAEHIRQDGIIQHMHAQVVGAYYDVHSGIVSWMD